MAVHNTFTTAEFKSKVLESNKLVLVDFWAEWCPPCRAMAPLLHDVADEQDAIADIVKIDIEATQETAELAGEYGVRSIPNMPIFKGGKEVERIVGMVPKVHLQDMFKQLSERK